MLHISFHYPSDKDLEENCNGCLDFFVVCFVYSMHIHIGLCNLMHSTLKDRYPIVNFEYLVNVVTR